VYLNCKTLFLCCFSVFFINFFLPADDFYSRIDGLWNVPATWSNILNGGAASTFPVAGDNVYIYTQVTIGQGTSATCNDIKIYGGLNLETGASATCNNLVIYQNPTGGLYLGTGSSTELNCNKIELKSGGVLNAQGYAVINTKQLLCDTSPFIVQNAKVTVEQDAWADDTFKVSDTTDFKGDLFLKSSSNIKLKIDGDVKIGGDFSVNCRDFTAECSVATAAISVGGDFSVNCGGNFTATTKIGGPKADISATGDILFSFVATTTTTTTDPASNFESLKLRGRSVKVDNKNAPTVVTTVIDGGEATGAGAAGDFYVKEYQTPNIKLKDAINTNGGAVSIVGGAAFTGITADNASITTNGGNVEIKSAKDIKGGLNINAGGGKVTVNTTGGNIGEGASADNITIENFAKDSVFSVQGGVIKLNSLILKNGGGTGEIKVNKDIECLNSLILKDNVTLYFELAGGSYIYLKAKSLDVGGGCKISSSTSRSISLTVNQIGIDGYSGKNTLAGTINTGTTAGTNLTSYTSTYNIVFGENEITPSSGNAVFFNSAWFGSKIINGEMVYVGDTTDHYSGSIYTNDIYITGVGLNAAFGRPVTFTTSAAGCVYFVNDFNSTKSLDVSKTAYNAAASICFKNYSGVTLQNKEINVTADKIKFVNYDVELEGASTMETVTLESMGTSTDADKGKIEILAITGETNHKIVFKNKQQLTLKGAVDVGSFEQIGDGAVSLENNITATNSGGIGIVFNKDVNMVVPGTTGLLLESKAGIVFNSSFYKAAGSAAQASLKLEAAEDIIVKKDAGKSAALFEEIIIEKAKDVKFNGFFGAVNFTQKAGSGDTYFAESVNISGNFDFTGNDLRMPGLKVVNVISVNNTGVWNVGTWAAAGMVSVPGTIEGGSVTQTGGAPAECWVTGDIISNAGITFGSKILLCVNSIKIRQTESGVGDIILSEIMRDSSADGNIEITTSTKEINGRSDVTINGNLGDSFDNALGDLVIGHSGVLTINSGGIYAKSFKQTQRLPSSGDYNVLLNVPFIQTTGGGASGGIRFDGNVKLNMQGVNAGIRFIAGGYNYYGQEFGAQIVFTGPVDGGNDVYIQTRGGETGSLGYSVRFVASSAWGAKEPIGNGNGYALEIAGSYTGAPPGDAPEWNHIIHGISANGPLKISQTGDKLYMYGDICINAYTGAEPTVFYADLSINNIENIKSGGPLEFRGAGTVWFADNDAAKTIRISTTANNASISILKAFNTLLHRMELITHGDGNVVLAASISVKWSDANREPKPMDMLYIECGLLVMGYTEAGASSGSFSINTGTYSTNRNLRIVSKRGVHYVDVPGDPIMEMRASGGGSDIIIQPQDPSKDIVIGDLAGQPDDFYIPKKFINYARAANVYIGSIKKDVSGGNTYVMSHGYGPADLKEWRNGAGNIYIGGASSINMGSSTAVGGSVYVAANLYILNNPPAGDATKKNLVFQFTGDASLTSPKDRSIYFDVGNTEIKSDRVDKTKADVEILGAGSLFFSALSIGEETGCIAVKTPALGSSDKNGVDAEKSAYIKNITASAAAIWKLYAGDVLAFSSENGIAQKAGFQAKTAHISAGKLLDLTGFNNIVDKITLENTNTTATSAEAIKLAVGGHFSPATDFVEVSVLNRTPGGSIEIASKVKHIRITGAKDPITETDMKGLESTAGDITIVPALDGGKNGLIYVGKGLDDGAGGVNPVKVSSAGNSKNFIRFRSAILSAQQTASPVANYSFDLDAGSGVVEFAGFVGAANAQDDAGYFDKLKFIRGTVTKNTASALFIAANELTLGENGEAVVIDSSKDANKDVTIKVNGLLKTAGGGIKTGGPRPSGGEYPHPWGKVQFSPRSDSLTVEYAPERQTGADVFYSSEWNDVWAESFVIGGDAHKADITLRGVSGTPFALTVKNSSSASIVIQEQYVSQNKELLLFAGSGGVVLNGALAGAASPAQINLGTAAFSLNSGNFILRSVSQARITAKGGLTINGSIVVDDASPQGGPAMILDAGEKPLKIGGNAGADDTDDKRLSSFEAVSSGSMSFGTENAGGSIYTKQDVSFSINDKNKNISFPNKNGSTISSVSGKLIFNADAVLNHAGGLHIDAGIDGKDAPVNISLQSSTPDKTAAFKSGYAYSDSVYSNTVTLKGENQKLASNGAKLSNITIDLKDSNAACVLTDNIHQASKIIINKGILNLKDKGWFIDGAAAVGSYLNSVEKGFYIYDDSSLKMAAGTALETDGDFSAAASPGLTLDLSPSSRLVFTGTGYIDVINGQKLGGVKISGEDGSNYGRVTLNSDIEITGNWEQWPAEDAFFHNSKSVTFSGAYPHEIRSPAKDYGGSKHYGVTKWHSFKSETPGLTLKFENFPAKHIFEHELTLKGSEDKPLLITCLNDSVALPNQPPEELEPSEPSHQAYWYIQLGDSGQHAAVGLGNIKVSYSFSDIRYAIEPPLTADISPESVNWLRRNLFIYSWTEDTDGNGQIDRIRAQFTVDYDLVREDISKFKPIIEDVITPSGTYSYAVKNCKFADKDKGLIYINLVESGKLDTGVTPKWRIDPAQLTESGAALSVRAVSPDGAETILPLDVWHGMRVADTAPPRIAYALSVPGKNQLYIKMSEPAASVAISGSFAGKVLSGGLISGSRDEFLFTLDSSFTPEELISAGLYPDSVFKEIKDLAPDVLPGDPFHNYAMAQVANTSPVKPYYPSHYKSDVNQPGAVVYEQVENFFNDTLFSVAVNSGEYNGKISQPNSFTSKNGETRASDILALRPARADAMIFWPIYAKDASGKSHGRTDGGIGTAVRYDGSEKLRRVQEGAGGDAEGVVIEAVGNAAMSGLGVRLFYSFDVPPDCRQTQGTPPQPVDLGVWLPNGASSLELNAVPKLLESAKNLSPSMEEGGRYFFNFTADSFTGNADKIDFLFKIGPLYGVRLESVSGEIPEDWYRKLRSFSVSLQDLQRQRGGATVLNNVINPLKNEIAALAYTTNRAGEVTIQVFAMDGALIKQLERGSKPAGDYTVSWDGKNNSGRPVARGMYFIRAVAPGVDEIRKVMVVK
jgi:hypothetical protein